MKVQAKGQREVPIFSQWERQTEKNKQIKGGER